MRNLIIVAVLLLAACATSQTPPEAATAVPTDRVLAFAAPTADTAPVTVTRDVGIMNAGCPLAFLVDGETVALIRRGETMTLYIPAGDRLLGVTPAGEGLCNSMADRYRRENSQRLQAGQPFRLRIGLQSDGEPFVQPASN